MDCPATTDGGGGGASTSAGRDDACGGLTPHAHSICLSRSGHSASSANSPASRGRECPFWASEVELLKVRESGSGSKALKVCGGLKG